MIPHSIFDLDHVDPLELVAEYSNDMTMSVDLIATRMAIIGRYNSIDTPSHPTLSHDVPLSNDMTMSVDLIATRMAIIGKYNTTHPLILPSHMVYPYQMI